MAKNLLSLIIISLSVVCYSRDDGLQTAKLTIGKIMQDRDKWMGTPPSGAFWSEDCKTIYFSWNPEKDTLSSLHSWQVRTGDIQKVSSEEMKSFPGRGGDYNTDHSLKVFSRNGNLFLLDIKKGTEKQLTGMLGYCSDPSFAKDGKCISFVFNQNLYLLTLETGLISQLSNFISGEEQPEKTSKGLAAWLENQQKSLFVVLKEREKMAKTLEYRRNLEKSFEPLKIYTGRSRLGNISLSPSGRFVIFSLTERLQEGGETSVIQFISESGYTESRRARTKVGGLQGLVKMGIFDIEKNICRFIKTDSIPGIRESPEYLNDYLKKNNPVAKEKAVRRVNLTGPFWNPEKDMAVMVALSHDNKDRWILLLDPHTGRYEQLDHQHDEAWIGGPGIGGWNYSPGIIGWMPDKKSVWFQSEISGYSHIYAVDCETKVKKTLTAGKFEIYDPFISRNKKYFYFTANKLHPGVKHFYRMPVSGGEFEQLTTMEGQNHVTLSPDEKTMAILFSTANRPDELYVQENRTGSVPVKITDSLTPEFKSYNWKIPEYLTFKARDSAEVHARLYRPEKPDGNGPAVIFVHGAGYLQNAHKGWSSYSHEYFFHNFLADNGYTVLDIDYRGSAGYGHDWRTAIYRNMGGKDLTDQIDGAGFLARNCGISPERIGIYGGSYGGFITLMAMFLHPEVFKAGAALRAVTDWAHYNHGYTSNILNTPLEDSLAFVRSSPIYYADGLKGALLMCHGMEDDNVHFQDIARLTQRLIELGKENWELAVYPAESHSFTESSSWTDEYKRIFKLFEENLNR